MAKLTRYSQKVFGSSDATQNFSQFGGFIANVTTLYSGSTITPALIQGLSNYLTGWTQAVIGNNAFAIEDFNSICFLFAYQLAYILQEGIPEWDSGTTYYTGSVIQSGGVIYTSSQDSNTNQQPGNGSAYWKPPTTIGTLTQNASNGNTTVTSGNTLTWMNSNIQSGDTITINSGAYFRGFGTAICAGTMVVAGTAIQNT